MGLTHLPDNAQLQGGKYRIVRFIGSGGFGCTYEGEHTMLGSKVAIKEFFVRDFCGRDETTSHVTVWMPEKRGLFDKLKKKFLEEAKAIWQMRHNNIVRVTDLFEENDTAYYVMDYIEGQSLEKMIKDKGSLSEQTALKHIRQVADALSYVHSLKRLHLDLKPANIMTDGHGKAILVDFGVSKQYDEVDGENTSTLMGKTPGYAPIEQMGNSVSTFTPSTDIYALGATLYKLLTGNTPPDSTVLASGEELPPLPSNISERTAKAVYEAMRPGKKNRPQSVADFLGLLDYGGAVSGKKGQERGGDATQLDAHQPQENPSERNEEATELNSTKNTTGFINGHEYVDLGLSVKWATCNVGASSPSGYGKYYAWGETKIKSRYTMSNSVTYGKQMGSIAGDPQYDAAAANWGGTWRMPTEEEIEELVNKCIWEWVEMDGHKGYEVKGPNGRSIFLPAAGWRFGSPLYYEGEFGLYWSASADGGDARYTYNLDFDEGCFYGHWFHSDGGRSVRPVTE